MSYLKFKLLQLVRRMWFLPAAFSLAAVLTLVIAFAMARFLPDELPFTISTSAVETILTVLASSLLTVAVFALSTMVGALGAVSSSTTPRAVPLIAGDLRAQTSISVFIGAFLFSVVGIIGLSAGIYSASGRLFLFVVTLGVVMLVVTALIRWIGHISAIGRVGHTIGVVEEATRKSLATMSEHPLLDCTRLEGEPKGDALCTERPGYVQHCDANELQRIAKEHDLVVTVMARPGAYATPTRPLMLVQGAVDDDVRKSLKNCFVLGDQRTFDTDPRFGFIVLGEIADKAMSASINDPGTAIIVIDTVTRLLLEWQDENKSGENDRVLVAPLVPRDVLEDFYRPIARDGAHVIEVAARMQKSLETLAACKPNFSQAAREVARDAAERAEEAMTARTDIVELRRLAAWAD